MSETGLVYTFTTAKLQPLVTQPEGKNLIQACLNAPHGSLPAAGGGGQPMNRMSNTSSQPARSNVPGGLSIGNKEDEGEGDEDDGTGGATPTSAKPRTRRRTSSGPVPGGLPSPATGNQKGPSNSLTSPNQPAPPQPGISMHQQQGNAPQLALSPPHGQPPPPYSQTAHPGQVSNVSPYSSSPDGSGGYLQGHGHPGHPQMLAQYHLNQSANHQPQHWGGQPTQPVSQNTQYGRR